MTTSLYALTFFSIIGSASSAPNYGPQPNKATQEIILNLREQAWRTWFSNDAKGFKAVVPDELVALGWSGGAWADTNQTIAQMTEFATSGTKLMALEFPENVFQHYGDVVILYTGFRITLRSRDGKEQLIQGRGTEIFVKRKQRWIHTGWHLDTVGESKEKK
jgi:ketosteroid isomerase-like protein